MTISWDRGNVEVFTPRTEGDDGRVEAAEPDSPVVASLKEAENLKCLLQGKAIACEDLSRRYHVVLSREGQETVQEQKVIPQCEQAFSQGKKLWVRVDSVANLDGQLKRLNLALEFSPKESGSNDLLNKSLEECFVPCIKVEVGEGKPE